MEYLRVDAAALIAALVAGLEEFVVVAVLIAVTVGVSTTVVANPLHVNTVEGVVAPVSAQSHQAARQTTAMQLLATRVLRDLCWCYC